MTAADLAPERRIGLVDDAMTCLKVPEGRKLQAERWLNEIVTAYKDDLAEHSVLSDSGVVRLSDLKRELPLIAEEASQLRQRIERTMPALRLFAMATDTEVDWIENDQNSGYPSGVPNFLERLWKNPENLLPLLADLERTSRQLNARWQNDQGGRY